MASEHEDGGLVLVTEMPSPHLTVDVYKMDGFACSVVAKSTVTVWDLKSLLKRRLQIPKRECMLLFGNNMLSLPHQRLGDAFGVMEGVVDVTLVRTPAICYLQILRRPWREALWWLFYAILRSEVSTARLVPPPTTGPMLCRVRSFFYMILAIVYLHPERDGFGDCC